MRRFINRIKIFFCHWSRKRHGLLLSNGKCRGKRCQNPFGVEMNCLICKYHKPGIDTSQIFPPTIMQELNDSLTRAGEALSKFGLVTERFKKKGK